MPGSMRPHEICPAQQLTLCPVGTLGDKGRGDLFLCLFLMEGENVEFFKANSK